MSFFEFASRMYPYWILGGFMFYLLKKSSNKDILTFNLKPFCKFFLFMICVCIWRIFMLRLAIHHGAAISGLEIAKKLPIGGTLFVWWEDLAHVAPLILLKRYIGDEKWARPFNVLAMLLMMVAFGSGHVYQGIFPAILLSFYIPFGVSIAKKNGLGTLMAGHMIYDFLTILSIRIVLGM